MLYWFGSAMLGMLLNNAMVVFLALVVISSTCFVKDLFDFFPDSETFSGLLRSQPLFFPGLVLVFLF